MRARSSRFSSRNDTCLRLCDVLGVGCVTAKQAMVVMFLDDTAVLAITHEYEVGLCTLCPRHIPMNRCYAESLEPET